MPDSESFRGRCFCGAVEIEVQGPPVAAAICHCESCRRWHCAPLNTWAVWPADKVRITAGQDQLVEFNKYGPDGPSARTFCKCCGSAILNRKPAYGMTVVYAAVLEESGFKYEPTFHSFYGEGVMHIADGLPKFADLPAELGGSGKRLEEPATTGMRS
ncbi:MAG TPA: GFA family protein [Rhodanobacteraceae bacterium]|nr:GFA family protein [Rhodanobacteraceae bacterium]